MGGTSIKRPSPHLHKVPTRSNKVIPRTLRTTLVYVCTWRLDYFNMTLDLFQLQVTHFVIWHPVMSRCN
jgi:hypothetical protein